MVVDKVWHTFSTALQLQHCALHVSGRRPQRQVLGFRARAHSELVPREAIRGRLHRAELHAMVNADAPSLRAMLVAVPNTGQLVPSMAPRRPGGVLEEVEIYAHWSDLVFA